MKAGQRGGGLLIVVLLLITAGSFAVVVAASRTGSDVKNTDFTADSLQALYLAETGIERALKRFATSASATPCASLTAESITDLTTIGLAATGHTIDILAGDTTDFSGVTLLPLSQCRVRATGTVGATGVTRTVHAIVDRNLLEGPDNPTFNNPTTAGAPSGWTLNPGTAFANNGGPDGTAPSCSRSLWLLKAQAGAFQARAQWNTPVVFTVGAGSTTTITFHWRLMERTGAGCVAGGNTGPGWPGAPCAVTTPEAQVCFRFNPAGAGGAVTFDKTATPAVAVACPDPGTPSTFGACSNQYQVEVPPTAPAPVAYPGKQSLTMTMGGGNVTNFLINARLQQANRREMFIDHIEATNPTAVGAAQVRRWRDCSGANNPVTCL